MLSRRDAGGRCFYVLVLISIDWQLAAGGGSLSSLWVQCRVAQISGGFPFVGSLRQASFGEDLSGKTMGMLEMAVGLCEVGLDL